MNRVAEVNRELKKQGTGDRLVRGKGYYYFIGRNADNWAKQSVHVYRAAELSLDEWLAEYRRLSWTYEEAH